MRRAGLPVLFVALLATGCSDDPVDRPTAAETTAGPSPTASAIDAASPTPSPSLTDDATGEDDDEEPTAPAEQPFPADRSEDTAEASGNGLTVVDVRTGRHDGYDRVVFELAGEGTPGWSVRYDDSPATQGRGDPVELAGDATLSVLITGVGYPFDTGVEEYAGPRTLTPGFRVVKEIQTGGVYEGYYDAFVGVAQERPFRVFRLDDPARVVLDVAHTG